jgi:predicted TIM-barrel fold metal-dependent hydrolase
MTQVEIAPRAERTAPQTERYLIVSADSHVGPSVVDQLRPYCEQRYLDAFDEDVRRTRAHLAGAREADIDQNDPLGGTIQGGGTVAATWLGSPDNYDAMAARWSSAAAVAGLQDPHARLRDMDAEGVAADVIFAGGQNDELLPFDLDADPEMRAVGARIFNRWMADFCSVAPARLHGVAQISLHDIPAAVESVRTAKDQGLVAVNFPAPQRGLLPYTEPAYEPFWAVCAELNMPLNTHGGGGDRGYWTGPGAACAARAEGQFMSRRALWALIFSGAFERHPGLKLVLTEQMSSWAPQTLAYLDGIWKDQAQTRKGFLDLVPLAPTEYWRRQVFVGDSFMSQTEVGLRHQIGLGNILYGTDYPHAESIFPLTRLALRHAYAGVPADEVSLMLGENALRCFDLDAAALRPVAERIGPTVAEIDVPTTEAELAAEVPPFCLAFREY